MKKIFLLLLMVGTVHAQLVQDIRQRNYNIGTGGSPTVVVTPFIVKMSSDYIGPTFTPTPTATWNATTTPTQPATATATPEPYLYAKSVPSDRSYSVTVSWDSMGTSDPVTFLSQCTNYCWQFSFSGPITFASGISTANMLQSVDGVTYPTTSVYSLGAATQTNMAATLGFVNTELAGIKFPKVPYAKFYLGRATPVATSVVTLIVRGTN